ncbi:MAG: trigger factor [Propionibacteriaceae bacterium]
MPSTVEQLSPTRVKITVEVPFADLKPSMDNAYAEIARTVTIPGFRKGKIPPALIDQRFGRGMILQEALNDALPKFYGEAVTENSLNPLAQPEVEVTKLEDGQLIEFTAEVDVRPDFDLPTFDDVNVTVDALELQDDAVGEQLDLLRTRFSSLDAVDRPVEDGDLLVIDLEATKGGEPLPDATAEDLSYEVGSGNMLDGLDDAVTGLSVGETATFTAELVGGPLKGTESEVTVTVKKVQVRDLPAADDDFAQLASEFDTIEELRANLRERLTDMARLEQAGKARDAVLEDLIAKINLDVPAGVLAEEITNRRQQVQTQLDQAGLTLEQYLLDAEEEQTEEEFWADVEKRAAEALQAQIILDKIADEREIGVDQNDLTQHILRRAQNEGTSPQQVAEHMQEHPHHIQEYMTEIRRGKALAVIVEGATVTDSNGDLVELANLQPDGSIGEIEVEGAVEGDGAVAGQIEGEVEDTSETDASGSDAAEEHLQDEEPATA